MTDMPLLVPSYNRPGAPLLGLAQRMMGRDYPWFVFVRRSQARDYLDAGTPLANLVSVADERIPTLGRTRNHMLRWARREGYSQVFDWDDDVFRVGRKLPDGPQHRSSRVTGNTDPWLDGPGYWHEAARISQEIFQEYPGTVVGSVQNQRWCKPLTAVVGGGKTPRRTKILHVDRLLDNGLTCPPEFQFHGEDIGNAALYLQYGWQIFTIYNLVYDFVSETDVDLPSTLRDRDEERNRALHAAEYESLMQYDIADYLRINKAYPDGSYMYGDVDWRKYRKLTGAETITYEYTPVLDRVPLSAIPYTTA